MLKKLACGQRKKLSLFTTFCRSVCTLAKGSIGFVRNAFKKKSCGASPLNGEENKKLGSLTVTMKMDKATGRLITSFSNQSY